MLKITLERPNSDPNTPGTLHLIGTIDETADFERQIPDVPKDLTVNCKKVDRINSTGIRLWVKFFKGITNRGHRVKFVECSPALVEQINTIPGFLAGGVVESIFVPFTCSGCHASFMQLNSLGRLKMTYQSLPEPACPKCGEKAIFDEIADEYFSFLKQAA